MDNTERSILLRMSSDTREEIEMAAADVNRSMTNYLMNLHSEEVQRKREALVSFHERQMNFIKQSTRE